MIEAKIDWSELDKELDELYKYAVSGKPQKVAGKRMRTNILERTSRFVDVDGKKLKKYTQPYKKYGRIRKGYGINPDLKREGNMLNSLGMQNGDTFGITSYKELDKADGNQKKRPFIGATENDGKQVAIDIVKDLP